MDIKKRNSLEDRFKLSGLSLKICIVKAGNRRYASVSSAPTGAKNPLNSQSEARLCWKIR